MYHYKKRGLILDLFTLVLVGIGIVFLVLVVTVLTVNKAYQFEHTIDELPKHLTQGEENKIK